MEPLNTADGATVTDDMLERWDDDADRGVYQGTPGKVFTRRRYGRPRLYDEPMGTVTLRLDEGTIEAAEQLARQNNTSRASMLRELLILGIREKRRHMA